MGKKLKLFAYLAFFALLTGSPLYVNYWLVNGKASPAYLKAVNPLRGPTGEPKWSAPCPRRNP